MYFDPEELARRIADFKSDVVRLPSRDVVRKHILTGSCYVMNDGDYFDLRSKIAGQYNLHTNDVYVVGSAKQGYSIAPQKRYRHFSDGSDVDVVVVSNQLFDALWKKMHDYKTHGGYWEKFEEFKNYHFNGWIRPDMFPPERTFSIAQEWWDFFNELSRSGKYSSFKVRGAIYRDWGFLESYQIQAVEGCAEDLVR